MNQAILATKQAKVAEIKETLEKSNSAVVVEYRGLSVAEVTDLRRQLRNENVDMKVYKNTMSQRAVEELGWNDLNQHLTGPNAIAFSTDAVAPCRVLAKFAKKHKALILKGGYVEGKYADLATIQSLSSLPNKEGMLSMFLSCLNSPVSSFARVVKAVADQKEAQGGQTSAPAKEEAPSTPAETPAEAPAEEPAKEAAAE